MESVKMIHQDLNQWCLETQAELSKLKLDIEKIKTGQKLLIFLTSSNIALIIAVIGVLAK